MRSGNAAEEDSPIVTISGREVGPGLPVYIVAELSGNHFGRYERAVALIHAAADAGVDAVKLQTYTPDTITLDSNRPEFIVGAHSLWGGRKLYDLYREAQTPWEWQPRLKAVAESRGLHLFSSPFDETAVQFLEQMHVPAYKVASFELTDLPLLKTVAKTGRPVILSTGMATTVEIDEAVDTLRANGAAGIILLKCTSAYPAPPEQMRLRAISILAERYHVPVGLSDHTLGHAAAIAAVALGACFIEKHLTWDRSEGGPDAAFSLEPGEFRELVSMVRDTERALGEAVLEPTEDEAALRPLRRSLFVVKDMKAGEAFTLENVRSIRPGAGLHTRHLEEILGRRASSDIAKGTPMNWDLVSP